MHPLSTATLTTIFSEVLSNLAFMFTDEEPVDCGLENKWLETVISYRGSTGGTLRFRCTRSFSFLLAANLLGTDPNEDVAESTADDAVREFMNILCGQFVTAVYGTEDVFNLTIPRIKELPGPPETTPDDAADSSNLSVEGQLVQVAHLPDAEDNSI